MTTTDPQNTKNVEVKRRKIRRSDWAKVEEFLKRELQARKDNPFRKAHERRWKEVDRQVAMEPMGKFGPGGKELPPSWQSAFELGELSKASEVICADVMRLTFPQNRTWMEAVVKPPKTVNPQTGQAVIAATPDKQKKAAAVIRALMTQQHADFGLQARVELSIKEALHHGSAVATCEWETQNKVHDGAGLESLSAPVWKPHSMWNCYPDSSAAVIPGANIFYTGSMMIVSYMPRYKVLELKGDGYMNIDPDKIKKKNPNKDGKEEDCEIVTYYGDLLIERDDGDIFLPNSKCKTANGTVIYYAPNEMPFPEVIYFGYERQDIRDPYFTSPLEKNSPMQKMVTILANEFIDTVKLWTQPAIVYDGNDPYMVQNGGVNLWPGAQTASKGSNKFQEVKIGDPKAALLGIEFGLQKIEEGTSVNAIRSGATDADRKTATEVTNTQQSSEVRTVDFVGKLEKSGLRPFLYMQHETNIKKLKEYSFYCPDKGLPDFLTISRNELQDAKIVHFEVVGSKGVLGEQRRSQQMTAVTAFASQNPLFAPLLNAPKLLIDMYEDAGVRGAEEYVMAQNHIPLALRAKMQQMEAINQELQQKLQEAESNMQAEMAKIALERQKTQEEIRLDREKAAADYRLEVKKMMDDYNLKLAELRAEMKIEAMKAQSEAKRDQAVVQIDMNKAASELAASVQGMATEQHQTLSKAAKDIVDAAGKIAESAKQMASRPPRRGKIKRVADGYEVEA